MIDHQHNQQHIKTPSLSSSSVLVPITNSNNFSKNSITNKVKIISNSPIKLKRKEIIKDHISNNESSKLLLPPRSPAISPSSSYVHLNNLTNNKENPKNNDINEQRHHHNNSSLSSTSSSLLSLSPSIIYNEKENSNNTSDINDKINNQNSQEKKNKSTKNNNAANVIISRHLSSPSLLNYNDHNNNNAKQKRSKSAKKNKMRRQLSMPSLHQTKNIKTIRSKNKKKKINNLLNYYANAQLEIRQLNILGKNLFQIGNYTQAIIVHKKALELLVKESSQYNNSLTTIQEEDYSNNENTIEKNNKKYISKVITKLLFITTLNNLGIVHWRDGLFNDSLQHLLISWDILYKASTTTFSITRMNNDNENNDSSDNNDDDDNFNINENMNISSKELIADIQTFMSNYNSTESFIKQQALLDLDDDNNTINQSISISYYQAIITTLINMGIIYYLNQEYSTSLVIFKSTLSFIMNNSNEDNYKSNDNNANTNDDAIILYIINYISLVLQKLKSYNKALLLQKKILHCYLQQMKQENKEGIVKQISDVAENGTNKQQLSNFLISLYQNIASLYLDIYNDNNNNNSKLINNKHNLDLALRYYTTCLSYQKLQQNVVQDQNNNYTTIDIGITYHNIARIHHYYYNNIVLAKEIYNSKARVIYENHNLNEYKHSVMAMLLHDIADLSIVYWRNDIESFQNLHIPAKSATNAASSDCNSNGDGGGKKKKGILKTSSRFCSIKK